MNSIIRSLPFCTLFLMGQFCIAQGVGSANPSLKKDSLLKELKIVKKNERTECLLALSSIYTIYKNDSSWFFASQALDEAEKNNDIKGKAKSYLQLGDIRWNQYNDFPGMMDYYEKAYPLLESGGAYSIAGNARLNEGWAYMMQSKFGAAQEIYAKALLEFKKGNNDDGLARTYFQMSTMDEQNGYYDKAYENTIRGLELYKKIDNPFGAANQLALLARLYSDVSDYPTALEYFHQSVALILNAKNLPGIYRVPIYREIGETHIMMKNYDFAYSIFTACFRSFRRSQKSFHRS